MEKKNLPATIKKFPSTNREVIQSFLITTARYEFSTNEKRILTSIVGLIQDQLEGKKLRGRVEPDLFGNYYFEIPITELMPEFDRHTRDYKNALINLRTRVFEYEDEDRWQPISIVEKPAILKKKGLVTFEIAKEFVDIFLDFQKGYSKYTLGISLGLKSVYAIRLYELLSNQKINLKYSIDKLKDIFQVKDKYKENTNFINRCIKPAKKELDEGDANWTFDYSLIKVGKKYQYIVFKPIHKIEKESEEVQRQEALRRSSMMWHLERNITAFLKGTCKYTDRELKGKTTLKRLQIFYKKYGNFTLKKMSEIWERAKENNNPKSYFMGAIKDEVKEFENI